MGVVVNGETVGFIVDAGDEFFGVFGGEERMGPTVLPGEELEGGVFTVFARFVFAEERDVSGG